MKKIKSYDKCMDIMKVKTSLYKSLQSFLTMANQVAMETPDPHSNSSGKLSNDGIKHYNKLAKKFNHLYKEPKIIVFREDTDPSLVTYPKTLEVISQLKLAIEIMENDLHNNEKGKTEYEKFGREFEYDIALSFAGEDRKIADAIANALIIDGVKVFYDKFYKTKMWGKKLTHFFQDVYGPKARFVIVLISKYYPIKDWTDFEFSIARGEAKKRKEEFILPVKLDDTKILGIHEDVGYLDFGKEGVDGVVVAVRDKLNIKERSVSKGIFITTLGVNFEDLVERGIISEDNWREYPRTCDRLEADLREKLDKSSIGEYHFTEPSARSGETLSVRFAHYWDLSKGLPDFSFTDYWDFLEFHPVEEIYPDSHKEVKSMFKETIPNKK